MLECLSGDGLWQNAARSFCRIDKNRGMTMSEPAKTITGDAVADAIRAAMQSPITRIYANGFGIAFSGSDISLVAQINDMPVGILTCSFETMKSLATKILEGIVQLEAKTGQRVLMTEEIIAKMMGPGATGLATADGAVSKQPAKSATRSRKKV